MFLIHTALAATPALVHEKVAATAGLRADRLGTHAPQVPADAYTAAANGTVTAGVIAGGDGPRKVWGVGVVDVPIDRYFSAINDDRSKTQYTKLDHVVLLSGGYCGNDRVVLQHLPVPVLSDRWWVVNQRINTTIHEASAGSVREMAWRPPPGGLPTLNPEATAAANGTQVEHTYGGWFLINLGAGQTLVEFWTWSDPGGMVPAGLAASFAVSSVEETLGSMAQLARKGPTCKL